MNKYKDTDKDIHKRIYKFVVSCHKEIVQIIPKRVDTLPLISQLTSSLTSIGANDREADASGSRKDFIAKYMIVRKEANETYYWLSLVKDLKLCVQSKMEFYLDECQELILIVSSIIKSAQQKR